MIFTNRSTAVSTNFYLASIAAGSLEYSPPTKGSVALVNNSQWHHVVLTVSGTTFQFYIDGTLTNSGPSTTPSTTGAGKFGNDDFSNSAVDLTLDEFAIYPLILSSTKVAYHFSLR